MNAITIIEPDQITVRVLKHDGAEYRQWNARVARRQGSLLVLDAEFEYDVTHHALGDIRRGTRTIEYYWLDQWYNVFRFLTANNQTSLFYCNVNMPPELEGSVLSYVDLDIDVLVQPDFSFKILDLDEFEVNAARYGYSNELKNNALAAVDEIVGMIESGQFPFDESNSKLSVSSVFT
jgi:protein associated with RNAse G/E